MPTTTTRLKAAKPGPEQESAGPDFEISEDVKLKPTLNLDEDPPACRVCFPNGWVGYDGGTAVGCAHGTWSRTVPPAE